MSRYAPREFKCHIVVRPSTGGTWWRVEHAGTCAQIISAIDELAVRIRQDARTKTAHSDELWEVPGESFWDDGHPLVLWEVMIPLAHAASELHAQAALIRRKVATGERALKGWNVFR
ncbi:hypothetical protein ACWIGI_37690 [Nocardia sp. NPDC055321]